MQYKYVLACEFHSDVELTEENIDRLENEIKNELPYMDIEKDEQEEINLYVSYINVDEKQI